MVNRKLILKKDNKLIRSLNDWRDMAPPKLKDLHWKDGRSAKELAKYILSSDGHIPNEFEKILYDINCKENNDFIGEPEAVTKLFGSGLGRNHDLLIKANNEIVIGIEAKADESLGKLVCKELQAKGITKNKKDRIENIYKAVYGNETLGSHNTRYQLLTATVGTLIEAEKINANKAMLLVITFKKDGCYEADKVRSNLEDIDYFIDSLSENLNGDKYNLPGYVNIDFYIKHLIIEC